MVVQLPQLLLHRSAVHLQRNPADEPCRLLLKPLRGVHLFCSDCLYSTVYSFVASA